MEFEVSLQGINSEASIGLGISLLRAVLEQ